MLNRLRIIKDIFYNIFFSQKYELFYVVESTAWSIYWDGKYITDNLNGQGMIKAKITTTHIGLKNKLIHFGSVNTLISKKGIRTVHPSNRIVLTWFHISPTDKRIGYIPELNQKANIVHTSCNLTKQKLIDCGLDENKIIVIPLGVDLDVFKPYPKEKINEIKKELGLPDNKIIIGSFQKDGEGWEDGLEPKMVKGPDTFCDTVEKLSQKYPLHILLTGPARGYVKKRLERSGIAYTHKFLKDYLSIADFYNTLDLYLVTSREEGGPKAILESMACGIPIVSTPVGMAPDVLIDDLAFLIATTDIPEKSELLMNDSGLKEKIIHAGLERVKDYGWKGIALQYFNGIYKKIK